MVIIRPHAHHVYPSDRELAAMRTVCAPDDWVVIHPDGTWDGPYDHATALTFL